MSDKRHYIRIDQPLLVTMTISEREVTGVTRDISLGGLLISCEQSASLGTVVSCLVGITDNPALTPMHFNGVIVRQDHAGVAIRFNEPLAIASRERLCQIIVNQALDREQALAEVASYRKKIIRSR